MTLEMSVFDNAPLQVNYDAEMVLNCVESGVIDISVSGGQPGYEIEWSSTNYQGFNFIVSREGNLSLSAIISDFCGVNQKSIQIDVSRETYSPLNVGIPDEVSYNCVDPVIINPIVQGGYGEYSFQWIQNGNLIHDELAFNQVLTNDDLLTLVVSDLCAPELSKTIVVNQETTHLSLNLGEDLSGECNTNFAIIPEVEGGFGEIEYLWKVNNQAIGNSHSLISELKVTSVVSLLITDACGTQSSDELTVYIQTQPLSVSMTADTALCENETLILNPILSGGHGDRIYFWDDRQSESLTYSAIPPGTSLLRFRVEDKCGYSVEKVCNVVIKDVIANFEFDYENQLKPIINNSTKNCWYDWFFPNGEGSDEFEPSPDYSTLKAGTTTLLVRNEIGCEAETRTKYDPPFRIFLPNAFTPDGDGKNDIFKAEGQFVESFELMIFNRWGKMIFATTDLTHGWNGEGSDEDYSGEANLYTYKYRAEDSFGRVDEGTGTVHLLR